MRTRRHIRQSVGSNCGGMLQWFPTIKDSDGDVLVLPSARFSQEDLPGLFAVYKDQIRSINSLVSGAYEVSLFSAFDNAVAGDEVELWAADWNPGMINRFINQAMQDAVERAYVNLPPIYHPMTFRNHVFEMASNVAMIRNIWRRCIVDYEEVGDPNAWQVPLGIDDVVLTLDYSDYQTDNAARFDFNTYVDDERTFQITQPWVSNPNAGSMTHLEGWIKFSSNGFWGARELHHLDLQLYVGSSMVAEFDLQRYLVDKQWVYLRIPIPNSQRLVALDSVRLFVEPRYQANGALLIDRLYLTDQYSTQWEHIDRERWWLEDGTRNLRVRREMGTYYPPFNFLRIEGGRDLELMDSDTDVADVDPWYVTARATELAFSSTSGGPETDPDRRRQQATLWGSRAHSAMRALPVLRGIRRVGV